MPVLSGIGLGLFYKAVMALEDHNLSPQDKTQFISKRFQRWTSASLWRKAVWFGAAYLACAEAGNHLSPPGGAFIIFWLPAGLYLAVLLLNPSRDWPWLVLAVLPANFLFDHFYGTKFPMTCAFYCANTVQAVTGAWLVRRFVAERPTLATLKEFVGLVGFAAVFSAMLGAAIGAEALVYFGLKQSFEQSWKVLWGSNAMAILLLTPFILTWFSSSNGARTHFVPAKKIPEAVLLLLILLIYEWLLFFWGRGIMSPNRSWAIPLLLWAGLRFGLRGATATSLFLSLSIAFFTTQFSEGLTPSLISSGAYVFPMQTILAMASLVALIPAIVLGERKRVEDALRESEARLEEAQRLTHVGYWERDLVTDLVTWSGETYRIFGLRPQERILNLAGVQEMIHPDDRSIQALKVKEAIQGGRPYDVEYRVVRPNGEIRVVHSQGDMIQDKLGRPLRQFGTVQDITDRKHAEQALRESEQKFFRAFRTSPDVISITDFETGHYLEVNDAHEKTFGFRREEVIGRSPIELGILEDPAVREKILEQLKAGSSIRDVEIQARTRDGRELTLLHSAELIELGGRLCVLRVSHDITDRKRAEAERTEALSREAQVRAEYTLQLIASQEAERTRIAGELHDSLGQTLSIIKNHAQLALLQKNLAGNTRKQLEAISDTTLQAIAELRHISRDLHPYQLDHLGLTRALEALIEGAAAASGITFKKKLDAAEDAFSRDAATNLYRIVQESVTNILKYSRARNARITLERDVHEVQLAIEDDGCGFKAGGAGKGMGLKNIAERARILGGRLKLDSAPGRGTRLEITIPISAGPE